MACETFCIEENEMVKNAKKSFGKIPLTEETVRFNRADKKPNIKAALEDSYKRQFMTCKVKDNKHLGEFTNDRATIFVDMESSVSIIIFNYFSNLID